MPAHRRRHRCKSPGEVQKPPPKVFRPGRELPAGVGGGLAGAGLVDTRPSLAGGGGWGAAPRRSSAGTGHTSSASLERLTALNPPANPEMGFMCYRVLFTHEDLEAQEGESRGPGSLSYVEELGSISGSQIQDSGAELLTISIRWDRHAGPT